MKDAKGLLLSLSLIVLITTFGLAPFTGAIVENVTSGTATDCKGLNDSDSEWLNISVGNIRGTPLSPSLGDSSTTWTVHPTDPSANFRTIQSAIDNSSVANGDSIEVWNGTYNENVDVNKRLTIYSRDGANVTIVDARGSGSAITIKADGCTVDGFKATGGGSTPNLGAGIKVESDGNIIRNNICENNAHYGGIYLSYSSNNIISNNTYIENGWTGIDLRYSLNNIISNNTCIENKVTGIYLWNSSNNTISNNTCCENENHGIELTYSSHNTISNNEISENDRHCIELTYSSHNLISKNTCCENNWDGIKLTDSSNNKLSKNEICGNNQKGIELTSSSNNIISNNTCCKNNEDGILLSDSSNNKLSKNEICENNLDGIHSSGSSNNTLSNNNCSNNNRNGIELMDSSNNKLSNNKICENNLDGICLTVSSSNVIFFNDFVNNSRENVFSSGSDNIWNSSSMITYIYNGSQYTNYTGNYWSDYSGADNNSDGIGDMPYDIFEPLDKGAEDDYDYYPLIRTFKFYFVNEPPVADFTCSPSKPFVNESVTFDASSSYDSDGFIAKYEWDFGDDSNATGEVITHSYRSAGDYIVKLTVTDNASATSSTSKVITIRPLIFPVHNLNTSENFSMIQDAIYAVNTTDGHIIEVDPGTYNENVKVNKSLTLRSISGNPADTIVNASDTNNHVFDITVNYVNISGFTITGATENGKAGIYLNGFGFCNISNNRISDNYHGISLILSNSNTVTDNVATLNKDVGIKLSKSSNNIIIENTLSSNNNFGIYFSNSTNNNLTTNTFSNSILWDIYVINSEGNNFAGNTLSRYPTTMTFTYAGDVALRGVRSPPADLSGYRNISKYVNVTNVTANSWLFLNINYTDADLGSVDESTLKMYRYNRTGWELLPGVNGVNETGNYVYANITSFSIFAPMGMPLPPVHNLNTSENFSTIQDAIHAVNTTDGHVIEVRPGTYNENVKVNKSLTIRSTSGNPADTFVQAANSRDHVFTITADQANISGFTIKGATGTDKAGIYISSSKNNITNNILTSNYDGLFLLNSNSKSITNLTFNINKYSDNELFVSSNNTMTDNNTSFDDNELQYAGGYGYMTTTELCMKNVVKHSLVGVRMPKQPEPSTSVMFLNPDKYSGEELFGSSSNNTITNNNVSFNERVGIFLLLGSNNNTISNNYANSNSHGIYLQYFSNYNIINNNNFSFNKYHSIFLDTFCDNNIITNNKVCFHNYSGIVLSSSDYNNLSNNFVCSNEGYGLYILYSYGNIIANNNLSYNEINGINICYSNNNIIINNIANLNKMWNGVNLYFSNKNIVVNNTVISNYFGGIGIFDSNNNKITNNNASLTKKENGIHLSSSSNNIITNNDANSNKGGGIGLFSSSDNNLITNNTANSNLIGLQSTSGNSNIIINNNFNSNYMGNGINLFNSSNNIVVNNSAFNNSNMGMHIINSSNNIIENNNFSHTHWCSGIELWGNSSNNIINNNIANSNGAVGIALFDLSSHNTITNNTASLSKRYHGIQLSDSTSYNTITNNTASFNNLCGIRLFDSSSHNIITNNDLFSNLVGLGLYRSEGNTSDNQIMNNNINLSKSYGIVLEDLRHFNNITNNNVSNNNLFSILVLNSTKIAICYNTANLNERGIGLYESKEIQLKNNVANSNKISGISLLNSTNNTIFNNSASFNTYEGIYLSNSNLNNISNNNVSSNYFGISLDSSNDNNITDNVAKANYYFEVFLYSSTGNKIINNTWYTQDDIIRGVRLYVLESLSPSLQSVENSTNATYYIIVENLGNVPDTFDLVISSADNPEILSLDRYNVSLGAGEISALEFGMIKLNVSDTEPGIYRAKIESISRYDDTVKDVIETWTIVQGEVDSTLINSTITNSALINSSINNAIINSSALINSIISDSAITDSIINNSEVVGTSLRDVILGDATVKNGNISAGTITINGITYEIDNETRIYDLVIGSDYRDSNLVGIKYMKTLYVDAENSNTSFNISAKDDYFAGSMSVQKSLIPPNGIPEFTNNVGGYVYANVSDNLANNTGWLIIKVFYEQNELDELNESSLRLIHFNETADPPGWEDIRISGVNLIENYVWGNISHYSVFAVEGAFAQGMFTPISHHPGGERDSDGDGLTDFQELIFRTDPNNPDTDGDGFTDFQEYNRETDPNNPDTDGDGFKDGEDPYPLNPNLPLRLTPTPTHELTPTLLITPTPTPVITPTPSPVPPTDVPPVLWFIIIIAIVAAVIIVSVVYL